MDISNRRLEHIIHESINGVLLSESQESKSISAAKKLVMQRLEYDEQQADEFVRIQLRGDIPILRTPQGGKFILGVTRMFCDGQLRDASTIGQLNTILKYVASDAHINEYDRNLNGMSAQDLISRFAKNVETDLENDKNELGSMQFNGNSSYDIVRIDSFEQASKYGRYTDWCVTYNEHMFDSYTNNGINQFYFCLKKGFKKIPQVESNGCPLDDYGLSMIAISVTENGALNTCTCRWNHDNDGNDNIMSTKEISEVIGMNFYEVFKPNNNWNELVENAIQLLANGELPRRIFDQTFPLSNGFRKVVLREKWNFVSEDNRLVSPKQWFDYVYSFTEGFALVKVNKTCYFINEKGERAFPNQEYEQGNFFSEGKAAVSMNGGKWYFINRKGELAFPDLWFDYAHYFHDGFAVVAKQGLHNYIGHNGKLLSPYWLSRCYDFNEGFGRILDGDDYYNFIDDNGNLLSNEWFHYATDFEDGYAEIVLKNLQRCYIDYDGNITQNKPVMAESSYIGKAIRESIMNFIKQNTNEQPT